MSGYKNKKKTARRDDTLEKNKKGIRQIKSDDDFIKAFTDEGEVTEKNEGTLSSSRSRKSSNLAKTNKSAFNSNKKIRVNKKGIPVLDDVEDLYALMGAKDETDSTEKNSGKHSGKKQDTPDLKTRHGIPILDKDDEFSRIFDDDSGESDFKEALEASLADKSQTVMLSEKKDKVEDWKPPTLKQRLSRYPLPQKELDLHGFKAIQADLTSESFIRNAYYKGIYTIRIIVGKGLHSEDGPVLPDIVEKRVLMLKKEEIVLAYEWDKKKKSKSGAITVYLNNYDSRHGAG